MQNISIINVGVGNITSVAIAFKSFNTTPKIINHSNELEKCDAIILPGVGNFKHTMEYLKKENFVKKLNELVIEEKIPFLGICLGMQLLAEEGEEGGLTKGLSFIPGKVAKLNNLKLKLPHMGWDDIEITNPNPLFKNLPQNSYPPSFYFVHNYILETDRDLVSSYCNYGKKFVSSVQKDNIFGVQFHPEKSQKNGMKLLENFLNYIKSRE